MVNNKATNVVGLIVRAMKKQLGMCSEYGWVERPSPCLLCSMKGKEILLTGSQVEKHFKEEHPGIGKPEFNVVISI